ncbi:hypothetical protein EIN_135850, partial [Entamoeba invadens IP1]
MEQNKTYDVTFLPDFHEKFCAFNRHEVLSDKFEGDSNIVTMNDKQFELNNNDEESSRVNYVLVCSNGEVTLQRVHTKTCRPKRQNVSQQNQDNFINSDEEKQQNEVLYYDQSTPFSGNIDME